MPATGTNVPMSRMEELAALNAYTEGKLKRYGLLFTVNGGAFAVAKLINGSDPNVVLGGLHLGQLAIGMCVFSFFMCYDIAMFGTMMREHYFPRAFGDPGKIVLFVVGGLLMLGWIMAGFFYK